MAISPVMGRVRPTRGFLIELRRRIDFVERGCELLKLKRDHLSSELRESLDKLAVRRMALEEKVREALQDLAFAYMWSGSEDIKSQIHTIDKTLSLEILTKSVMGVLIPFVKIQSAPPPVKGKFKMTLGKIAIKFQELLDDLIKAAELEARVERIALELGRTSRKVNALEKIVIPSYKQAAKYIEDLLEEGELEEFVRTKLIRDIITGRRQ